MRRPPFLAHLKENRIVFHPIGYCQTIYSYLLLEIGNFYYGFIEFWTGS